MEAIFAISAASKLSSPFHPHPRSQKTVSFDHGLPLRPTRRPFCRTTPMASRKEANNGGSRMVDENMIVLRMRIREMKMAEGGEFDLPANWTEWEKSYYSKYNSLICEAIGVLQNQLMSTRPAVAFGMVVLIALILLLSSVLLVHQLLEIALSVLGGLS